MRKEKALEHIKKNLSSKEELVGFFHAQVPFKIWLFFIIGPLAVLSMKIYIVAVTNKGMYFYKLNLLGKFAQYDFWAYSDIKKVKIGKGMLQIPMKYFFSNGRKLGIKAYKNGIGIGRAAKIEEKTLEYIKQNIQVA